MSELGQSAIAVGDGQDIYTFLDSDGYGFPEPGDDLPEHDSPEDGFSEAELDRRHREESDVEAAKLDLQRLEQGGPRWTILHALASQDSRITSSMGRVGSRPAVPTSDIIDPVRPLVRRFPELLEARSKGGATPLHVAILTPNPKFVETVLEDVEDVDQIFRLQDESGSNCIHAAMRSTLSVKLIIEIVKRASKDTLCMRDIEKRTPIFLAAQYELCRRGWTFVVRALINRADEALDAMVGDESAYQHLERSKENPLSRVEGRRQRDWMSKERAVRPNERPRKDNEGPSDPASPKVKEGVARASLSRRPGFKSGPIDETRNRRLLLVNEEAKVSQPDIARDCMINNRLPDP